MKNKLLSVLLAISMITVSGAFAPALAEEAGNTDTGLALETVIEPQYDAAGTFSNGLAAVQTDGLWGYINQSGEMVIPAKYQTALEFFGGEAVVAFEDGTMPEGEQSIYALRDDCTEILLTSPGYYTDASGQTIWSTQAPQHYNPEYTSLGTLRNHYQNDVLVAAGSAYLADGTRIEPAFKGMNGLTPWKATDFGFCQNYQDYMVLGPCVNGIIPCKALYYNKVSYGQCFFMDKDGKILNVFRSLDQLDDGGGQWGVTSCFAPDPETGLIAMKFAPEPSDFWTFVDDADNYASFQTVDDSLKFRNFIIRSDGSTWSRNIATAMKQNGKVVLLTYNNSAYSALGGKEYEDATMFSEGYCSVKEDGEWHYIDPDGNVFAVGGPDGGTAKAAAAGLFENGIAPVYDETSDTYYLVSRTPEDGVFPAVAGSDCIAGDVYFDGFTPGEETGGFMGFTDLGSLIVIEKDGKYGFAKLNGTVPDPTPTPTPDPTPDTGFVDVVKGSFYEAAVNWAVNHDPQITNGTSPTTFSPGDPCTRGQVVTFLWRAAGQPEPTITENPFSDVASTAFYYKAVLWGVENGITKGTSDTTFSPAGACTRGQVVTFLHRTVGEPAPASSSNPFSDVSSSAFYYTAVLWAVENNVTNGMSENTFAPGATCSRGQIVTFLYRALG